MTATTIPMASPAPGAHKLWGGRFAGGPAAEMDALNRSIGTDFRLWPHDIRLSKAWALALWNAGVLTLDESEAISKGLDAVAERIAGGAQPIATDEDVHTMIDRLLHDAAGTVASKLHTGRSRNDQVATATRLWTIAACTELDDAVRLLQEVLLARATEMADALMPAYTHLQRAQPVSAAHWLLSHFWALDRDRHRLAQAQRAASVLPLGSGAIAGSAFPVSRVLLKESLGFHAVSLNSIDAVGDRDFIADLLYTVTMIGVHVSRIAEDGIVYGSSEFGFLKFGDRFSTGSSMMPQKRNPDALEIARGFPARVLGDLVSLVGTLKGLPSGYNKDLQDDKRALFDAVDTVRLVLPAVAGTFAELRFDQARMRAAVTAGMMATDLADYLVRKGATFRESHGAVGSLVRQAEEAGVELDALPAEAFTAAHALFGADAREALGAAASVAHREVEGGTGPNAIEEQLAKARAAVMPRVEPPGNAIEIR
ncbi:MAG: argininosuccinate lyase [Gemmatimonadaceae bacterium]|jgi:argininosuccinate lyase|nr:argininosuccinate lyase [Gemmatimonadaceae bacterium]